MICHHQKQTLFNQFIEKWDLQFSVVPAILKALRQQPAISWVLEQESPLIHPDELKESQKEWVWLISKFEHPLEINFFKPYWVPLQSHVYDYFIDLSDPRFKIFQMDYIFFEPYAWHKNLFFKNAIPLVDQKTSISSTEFNKIKEQNEQISNRHKKQVWKNCTLQGIKDELPLGKFPIRMEGKTFEIGRDEDEGDFFFIYGSYPGIITFFPWDAKIKLKAIVSEPDGDHPIHLITTIKGLLFYFEKYATVLFHIKSFFFSFEDHPDIVVSYNYFTLAFKDTPNQLVQNFLKKAKAYPGAVYRSTS